MTDNDRLKPRDHGGDIDAAIVRFGDGDWIDLSTGINPVPYGVKTLQSASWSSLPSNAARADLERHAGRYFGNSAAACLAMSGAQAAIQLLPHIVPSGNVAILGPTYNEHAARFRARGAEVLEISDLSQCTDDVKTLVIVNPNNPDGRVFRPDEILKMKDQVETLIVDESFADVAPEASICDQLGAQGVFALRSFGKFFGLAGIRLGFVLGNGEQIQRLRDLSGPWSVNGPALEIGRRAYQDAGWISSARNRLKADCARLDVLAERAGWAPVGGCDLFRTYDVGQANLVRDHLAAARIWTRIFPYSQSWMRFGLPGCPEHWARLENAISDFRQSRA